MSNTELIKTYVGKVDLQTKVGYAVKGTTDAKVNSTAVVTIADAGAQAVGIIVDPGLGAGTAITVQVGGYAKAIVGADVNAFAPLKTDANGALITASTAGDIVVAYANEAIASGKIGEVKVVAPSVIKIA